MSLSANTGSVNLIYSDYVMTKALHRLVAAWDTK